MHTIIFRVGPSAQHTDQVLRSALVHLDDILGGIGIYDLASVVGQPRSLSTTRAANTQLRSTNFVNNLCG